MALDPLKRSLATRGTEVKDAMVVAAGATVNADVAHTFLVLVPGTPLTLARVLLTTAQAGALFDDGLLALSAADKGLHNVGMWGLAPLAIPRVNAAGTAIEAVPTVVDTPAVGVDVWARNVGPVMEGKTLELALVPVSMTLVTASTPDDLTWNLSLGTFWQALAVAADADIAVPTMAAKHIGSSFAIYVTISGAGTPAIGKNAAIKGADLTGHPDAASDKFLITGIILPGPVCSFTGWVEVT